MSDEHGAPLHAACVMGRLEAVRFLFDRCAKTDYVGKDGTNVSVMDTAVHQKFVRKFVKNQREEDTQRQVESHVDQFCEGEKKSVVHRVSWLEFLRIVRTQNLMLQFFSEMRLGSINFLIVI